VKRELAAASVELWETFTVPAELHAEDDVGGDPLRQPQRERLLFRDSGDVRVADHDARSPNSHSTNRSRSTRIGPFSPTRIA
jgi:hypothetical protein